MLIGLVGLVGHGKTSVANLLIEKFGFIKFAFADGVREMAEALDPVIRVGHKHYALADGTAHYRDILRAVGYAQAKQLPEVRQLLQRIGTEAGRNVFGKDVWVRMVERKLAALGDGVNVVIDDVRFENEAQMIQLWGGHIVRVVRPNFDNGVSTAHESESTSATLAVDATITTEDFDTLRAEAEGMFMHFASQVNVVSAPPVFRPRVYIAGTFEMKADAIAARDTLVSAGITVVSGWTEREGARDAPLADRRGWATEDMQELHQANTLVILAQGRSSGKATEMGAALEAGYRVIAVNAPIEGNVFYALPSVEHVATVEEAAMLLGADYAMNTTEVSHG